MSTVTSTALAYYSRHGASLFPMPAGSKSPVGIVASWKQDHSPDPKQWAAWSPCNFGVVASASRWIIVDVDVGELGRDRAWALWSEWCVKHDLPVYAPHVQSARGGWHFYFAIPEGTDPATLTQRALIGRTDGSKKAVVDTRVEGFVVAAGSTFGDLPYILLSDATPHPAPVALLTHLTRAAPVRTNAPATGTRDAGDVAALVRWLAERDQFADYESWVGIGMALKIELGDAGFDIWTLATWPDAADLAESKWQSFATEPTPDSVTLASFLQRAHNLGWRGSVRKSTAALFDGVAAIAKAAGAALPGDAAPMPMMAGQIELTRISLPILDEFLTATSDAPTRPSAPDYPTLPDSMEGHGLFKQLRDVCAKIVAMAESKGKMSRTEHAAAVLQLVHQDTYDALDRRCSALGNPLPARKIKLAAASLSDRVERSLLTHADWIYDAKGYPEANNSDNVAVFLGITCTELRWNAWLDYAEIRGFDGQFGDWTMLDDAVVAKMRTRANRTKTRFVPGREFFWESLIAIAQANSVDPAVERLATLQAAWDGRSRLATWLSATCGVPCDLYHQAVSKNVIGGMVRRIRQPGCKHDEIAIFLGPQGTGKSTLARLIAMDDRWFSDEVLFGDASKELVLSLAGISVVEVAEMGVHGSANNNHVKAMLSRQADRGRTAYARTVSKRMRRNIFIGTTNESEPLQDPTGNRRFLPVLVGQEINTEWLRDNIGQLIGEAATLEAAGATFALPREVWSVAAAHQEAARAGSDIETMLGEWFGVTEYTEQAYVTASDLVTLSMTAGWRNAGAHSARTAIMKRLGFREDNVVVGGKKTRLWVRGSFAKPGDIARATRYEVGSDAHGKPVVRPVRR